MDWGKLNYDILFLLYCSSSIDGKVRMHKVQPHLRRSLSIEVKEVFGKLSSVHTDKRIIDITKKDRTAIKLHWEDDRYSFTMQRYPYVIVQKIKEKSSQKRQHHLTPTTQLQPSLSRLQSRIMFY